LFEFGKKVVRERVADSRRLLSATGCETRAR